jgi:hypothetical protein
LANHKCLFVLPPSPEGIRARGLFGACSACEKVMSCRLRLGFLSADLAFGPSAATPFSIPLSSRRHRCLRWQMFPFEMVRSLGFRLRASVGGEELSFPSRSSWAGKAGDLSATRAAVDELRRRFEQLKKTMAPCSSTIRVRQFRRAVGFGCPRPQRRTEDMVTDWLRGKGETAERIRAMDWSTTPLGPRASWPQPLRTAVNLTLRIRP